MTRCVTGKDVLSMALSLQCFVLLGSSLRSAERLWHGERKRLLLKLFVLSVIPETDGGGSRESHHWFLTTIIPRLIDSLTPHISHQ